MPYLIWQFPVNSLVLLQQPGKFWAVKVATRPPSVLKDDRSNLVRLRITETYLQLLNGIFSHLPRTVFLNSASGFLKTGGRSVCLNIEALWSRSVFQGCFSVPFLTSGTVLLDMVVGKQ